MKKLIIYVVFLLTFIFLFSFYYNYMSYDILLYHDRFYVFSSLKEMLYQGRFPGKLLLGFFYQFIPSLFPNINLNDLQNTIIAMFKSLIITLIVAMYTKLFFIFDEERKSILSKKSIIIVAPILSFFIFNNFHIEDFSFMGTYDSTYFFDWEMNVLFYVCGLYILIKLYILKDKLNFYEKFLSIMLFFIISICNEFISFAMFCTIIFLIMIETTKILIYKYKQNNFFEIFFRKTKQLTFYFGKEYIKNSKKIIHKLSFFILIMIIGLLIYVLCSNYNTLEMVGGGHTIDFIESISKIKENLTEFILIFNNKYISPLNFLYLSILLLIIYIQIKKIYYARKITLFILAIYFGLIAFISTLIIGGKSFNGTFFLIRTPIVLIYTQICFLIFIFLVGYIIHKVRLKSLFEKKDLILCSALIIFTSALINNNFYNYVSQYQEYIENAKEQRTVAFNSDKIAISYGQSTGVAILPFSYYKLYNDLFYRIKTGCLDCPGHYEKECKIKEKEIKEEKSFLYTFDVYTKNSFQNTDNYYFLYLNNIYNTKIEALLFINDLNFEKKLKEINLRYNPKQKEKIVFSEINKIKKISPNEIENKYKNKITKYISLGRYYKYTESNKAINFLNKAIEIDNSNLSAHIVRGLIYRERKESEKAIKDLSFVVEQYPSTIFLQYLLANEYKKIEDYNNAIKIYDNLVSLFPYGHTDGEKDYYFLRGETKEIIKDYNGALKDYINSSKISIYSDLFLLNEKIGNLYIKLNNINKAADYFEQQIKYTPEDNFLYYKTGLVQYKNKEIEEALENFLIYINNIEKYSKAEINNIKQIKKITKEIKQKKVKFDNLIEIENKIKEIEKVKKIHNKQIKKEK